MTTLALKSLRIHAFVIACILALCVFPTFIHAQEEDTIAPEVVSEEQSGLIANPYKTELLPGDEVYGDFVVGPGKLEVEIKPGQTKIVQITVTNRTGGDREFELVAEDAAGSSDPAQALVLLGDDRGPYSMKDYVSVPSTRFILKHNERARIPVTISIPPDAEAGGLYGSMLVSTVSVKAQAGDEDGTLPQSAVVARIGSIFFITIPGATLKEGVLKNFATVPEKTVYQNGPIQFGILFENTGSVHLSPYGEIRVKNMFDEEVGFVELDPWFVLPKAVRLREVSWNREFLFGKYTATAYINRGYDDVIDEIAFTFWVLPWKPIVGAFLVLFAVFFLTRAFFRAFEFKRRS